MSKLPLIVLFFHLSVTTGLQCSFQYERSKTLSYLQSHWNSDSYCWKIIVPKERYVTITIESFTDSEQLNPFVNITVWDTGEEYIVESFEGTPRQVRAFSDVTVTFKKKAIYYHSKKLTQLIFHYDIKELTCLLNNSFECDNHTCVDEKQVCDGIENCKNGEDEVGCETGILAIHGIEDARKTVVSSLLKKHTSWGWKENTPRAVTALYLGSAANYNGSNIKEELMAKETALSVSTSLLRSTISKNDLSMFINALLVTCYDPRHFFGNNLVKQLKQQVEQPGNFTHPLSYLALCNANESWPQKATQDLHDILESDSSHPFTLDLQAIAHMALSCASNHTQNFREFHDASTHHLYLKSIQHFVKLLNQDGSFGNLYTTSFITQALIASDQMFNENWQMNKTINYLIRELKHSSQDFLALYLTLPILNGKSLVDVRRVNCSTSQKREDPISEVTDYIGNKIRVKYSLFIGDKKDVIHSMSLLVPENYTAFEVMQLAKAEDPKYSFEWKAVTGGKYIYKIANVLNDPEHGRYWLLYIQSHNSLGATWDHPLDGPEKVVMRENRHLILWYKTARI